MSVGALSLLLAAAAPAGSPADAAECLVRRSPAATLALVSSEPNSSDEGAAILRFRPHLAWCRTGPLPVDEASSADFRAAISRAAVSRYMQGTRAGANSNPDFSPNLFPVDRGFDQAAAMQGAYRLARCIVTIDYNGAARLIETDPGKSEERTAVEALRPDVAACIDKGRQAAVSRPRLRSAIEIVFARQMAPLLRLLMPRR
jgi:hypothetical protein